MSYYPFISRLIEKKTVTRTSKAYRLLLELKVTSILLRLGIVMIRSESEMAKRALKELSGIFREDNGLFNDKI